MVKKVKDKLIEFAMRPHTKPLLFKEGQTARVLNGLSDDGQTPEYWDGAKVTILSFYKTAIFHYHVYTVKHLEKNVIFQFKEEELDRRFIRHG